MNRIAGLTTIIALSLNAMALSADDNIISDTSVRVIGFHATPLVNLIRKHDLAPEDVQVFGPDEPGDVTTQFVMLLGWESVNQVPGAKEVCADLCDQQDEDVQLVSSTVVAGNSIRKSVFIDLNQLAPQGNIIGSFGLSGCVVDQIFNEARMIKPKTEVCLPRLAGDTFTDQRDVERH